MAETPSVPPRDKRGQRTGYTTGSNASAAAKAAAIALLTGQWPEVVEISLPIGETAAMRPVGTEQGAGWASCGMVKDAGDDPDVTHGALICARVSRSDRPGIHLEGGEGVGRVTRPGLGLAVGGPAINPVPRQQITENVLAAVRDHAPGGEDMLEREGLDVVISVPEGARIAQRTLNARLGIVGGISILGTTGKVFPYSTAAWRASVIQAVEMAAASGAEQVVMSTGGRSEKYAMRIYPHLPEGAFVELSIFTGDALRTCVERGVRSAAFVGMVGKMIKTAQGYMQTHVAANQVDFAFLAQVCREVGAPEALAQAVAEANTGRHFLELCQEHGCQAPLQRVVDLALERCMEYVASQGGALALDVVLVDFDGPVLAQAHAARPEAPARTAEAAPFVERLAADPGAFYHDDDPIAGGDT